MDRKLSYKKQTGTRVLGVKRLVKKVVSYAGTVPVSNIPPQLPSAYRKEDGMLSYSLICVISGGTTRERAFLYELERKHTFKSLDVIFYLQKRAQVG